MIEAALPTMSDDTAKTKPCSHNRMKKPTEIQTSSIKIKREEYALACKRWSAFNLFSADLGCQLKDLHQS